MTPISLSAVEKACQAAHRMELGGEHGDAIVTELISRQSDAELIALARTALPAMAHGAGRFARLGRSDGSREPCRTVPGDRGPSQDIRCRDRHRGGRDMSGRAETELGATAITGEVSS